MVKTTALLIMVIILFCTCTKLKKVSVDYPQVKTLSATVLPNGSVRVSGQVLHEGVSGISYAGFSFDTTQIPNMLANQVLSDTVIGDSFSYVFPLSSFNVFKTYNFIAWVVNKDGYSIGSPVSLNNISITVPCNIKSQTMYSTYAGDGTLVGINPNDTETIVVRQVFPRAIFPLLEVIIQCAFSLMIFPKRVFTR